MKYQFKDDRTGEFVTLDFPVGTAPRLGETMQHEGRRLRRIASPNVVTGDPDRYPDKGSRSLPRGLPGMATNDDGQVLINSRRDLKQAEAASGMTREL